MTCGEVHSLSAPGQPHVQTLPHSSAPNSTKQMLADIMQFQPRDSLEEMLSLPLSREQVSGQAAWEYCLDTGAPLCPCSPLHHSTGPHICPGHWMAQWQSG